MPTYEYKCKKCDESHEQVHGMTAKPGKCPHCGSTRLEKQLFPGQFALKGGGWESDGYRSSGVDKKAEKRFKDATGE